MSIKSRDKFIHQIRSLNISWKCKNKINKLCQYTILKKLQNDIYKLSNGWARKLTANEHYWTSAGKRATLYFSFVYIAFNS